MSDGPTLIPAEYLSCSNCTHHRQAMMRSGLDPIYEHTCVHPEVVAAGILPERRARGGRHIGTTDRTPSWCPFTS